ncbi:serine hydrolase domain-containing protein [Flagellimonas sp. 2504JD1-5]
MQTSKIRKVLVTVLIAIGSIINAQSKSEQITELLQDHLIDKGKRPVHNIMVYIKDGINNFEYHNGLGIRGRDKTPIDKDHQYRIASITKTFIATLILQLYEEGKIDLDNSILNYVEGYKLIDIKDLHVYKKENYTDSITVRMLLNHTSGIADVFTDASFRWNLSVFFHPSKQYDPVSFMRKFSKYRLNKKPHNFPGKGFSYTDVGYMVLGFIIESVTGTDLPTVLRNRILEPLNMKNTYFEYYEPPTGNGKHIDAYLNRINMTKKVNTSYEWAGGGLISTTKELGVFFEKLFTHQLFKQRETLDLMTDISQAAEFGADYGLGITKYTFNNNTFYGHSGFYGSLTAYSPIKKAIFSANIGQANPPYNTGELIEEILKIAVD